MSQRVANREELLSIIRLFEDRQQEDEFEASILRPRNKLEDLLRNQPDVFYRCVLGSDASRCSFAVPVDRAFPEKIQLDEEISLTQGSQFVVKVIDFSSGPFPVGRFFGKLTDKPPYEAMQTRAQLLERMAEQPAKYKICHLHLDGPQLGWAFPVSPDDQVSKIQLKGRSNCGRACEDDQVIVELMNAEELQANNGPGGQSSQTSLEPSGRVVGVYKQRVKLRYKLLVCEMLDALGTCMRPLCGTVPKISYDNSEDDKFRDVERIREVAGNDFVPERRNDFRSHITVTIDGPDTKDMDDAISLKKHKNGKLTVGVHITDLAEFVGEDTPIDREARRRGVTYYPSEGAKQKGATANHMLPRQLAESLISLVEGQDRRCVSVVFNLNANGLVESSRVCLTVIRSDKRLNKEDVQRPRIEQMLLRLWSVTRDWRLARLGQAAFVRQENESYPETSALVEELMLAANSAVGDFLHRHGDSVPAYPIRVQQRPREIDVTRWIVRHGPKATHSAELSRALKLVGKEVLSSNIPFQMHNEDAENLRALCQRGDNKGALSLLYDERRFPHLKLAIRDWHGLCELAQYSESTSENRLHFSLEKEDYVHFTSPMRRYADLMVHRAHKMLDQSPKVARTVQFRSLSLSAVPSVIEEEKIVRCNWTARILRHTAAEVVTSSDTEKSRKSHRSDIKVANSSNNTFFRSRELLSMKKELLSKNGDFEQCGVSSLDLIEADLTERRGVAKIYALSDTAGSIVNFYRDFLLGDEVRAQIGAVRNHGMLIPTVQLLEICDTFSVCLAHRRRPADNFEQVAQRRSKRSYDDVVEYADIWQGIVAMESASVSISNNETFVLCDVPLTWKWDDENNRWLGMFNLTESLCQRRNICFTDSVLIESNKSWQKKLNQSTETKKGKKRGVPDVTNAVFKAAKSVKRYAEYICLRAVQDEYTWVGHGGILLVFDGIHCRSDRCNDKSAHFCNFVVFHLNEVSPVGSASQETLRHATVELIMKFLPIRRHELVLQTLRGQSEHRIAGRLVRWDQNEDIRGGTGKTTTGVMLIYWFVFINHHRSDGFMNLEDSSEDEDEDDNESETEDTSAETSKESQDDGFQVVQYPHRRGHKIPGRMPVRTSSSDRYMGKRPENRKRQSRRQILCCGPSNRSVDVIIEASRDLLADKCPSMVRVYSEQVERMHYPVPGEISTADEVSPAMKRFALHELIRSENSDDAYIIGGFDDAFKLLIGSKTEAPVPMEAAIKTAAGRNPRFDRFIRNNRLRSRRRGALELAEEEAGEDALVQGCVKLYKDKLLKSKERVLQNFDVVLCTTSVSCSSVLQRACRFVQIIIDEAGMCTQPELLVPIYAERVVLIGDHKQLAPIIQSKTAAELGLSKTFLEMHCLDSVMLNQQYRMHPSLADFPSKRFYTVKGSGGLCTQPSKSWTGVLDVETRTQGNARWTGLNWHRLAKHDLFDSRGANGVRRHGLLTQRNANVLHGCWPGVRRNQPFDTLPDVPAKDFHPMGEEERIVFLHIQGQEERTLVATEDGREDSYKNELEIKTVVRVYKEIHNRLSGDDKKDPRRCIAVMSQYKYQVSEITRRLKEENLAMPTVNTVIACQGSEFAYVLLSLVRSMPDYDIEANPLPGWEKKFLGFITDENQTNVALTRAQRGLVIVGNKSLLRRDPNWSHLIFDLEQRGCVPKNPADFPNRTGDRRAMTASGK
uniref:RNB domain-containing protein n=1 Tax=Macrostomum lignano TaxID=282301 RepID=A0A1I8HZU7_9PLAT